MNKVAYEKSLEYFAKLNGMEYLLEEFSDKNQTTIKEVSKGSTKECFWNCPKCKSEYLMSVDKRVCRGRK